MPPSRSWKVDATGSSKTLVSTWQYAPQVLCNTVIRISYKPWKRGRPIGHILHWNRLLQHVIEGKIEGSIKVTVRRGKRHKQLSKEKPTWCHLFYYFIQCSFNAQHVLAANTTIFRSLRLIGCYFMGGIWFGVCWRSVSVWLWRCGVFTQCFRLHKDTTPP